MNYYEFLGVGEDASSEAIQRAYRKLALKHHPDKSGDSQRDVLLFQILAEVRDTLLDSTGRARYDRNKAPVQLDKVDAMQAQSQRLRREAEARKRALRAREYRWQRDGNGMYELHHLSSGVVVQRLSRAQVDQVELPPTTFTHKLPSITVLRRKLDLAVSLFLEAEQAPAATESRG